METLVAVPEIVWNSLVNRVETLEKEFESQKKRPSEITWITREQAAKILNCDVQTVSDKAKSGQFEYRKGLRKIEFNLQSIKDYMKKSGVSQEAINRIVKL